MRAVHAATYRVAVGKILAANREGRERLRTQARAMGWLEWLHDRALAGDSRALAALRPGRQPSLARLRASRLRRAGRRWRPTA